MEAKNVSARDVLTPDTLSLVQAVVEQGSFAAAARQLGLVPSAVTYRIRQLEDALDVLLFDRSSRQARLTAAGSELLSAAQQLLQDIDAIANRVKRVATGWEAEFTIAVDAALSGSTVMELADAVGDGAGHQPQFACRRREAAVVLHRLHEAEGVRGQHVARGRHLIRCRQDF